MARRACGCAEFITYQEYVSFLIYKSCHADATNTAPGKAVIRLCIKSLVGSRGEKVLILRAFSNLLLLSDRQESLLAAIRKQTLSEIYDNTFFPAVLGRVAKYPVIQ